MAALTFGSSISRLIHTNNSTSPFSLMIINLKSPPTPLSNNYPPPLNLSSSSSSYSTLSSQKYLQHYKVMASTYRYSSMDEEEEENELVSFDEAVVLFNKREYYKCHDYLESLWNKSQDPTRTLVHGILQCAVGFHHLFNQNHNGAMMELGEGLCKLRKMNLETGPFYQFEIEISVVLDFIYQTQLELAACIEDLCLAMDQSEASYKLLGGYASGQRLYCLETDANENVLYIVFCPPVGSYSTTNDRLRVKLPTLHATQEQLMDFNYT